MLQPEIALLTKILKDYDYHITIETAGLFDIPVHCDLMSISPKLRNSTPIGLPTSPQVVAHEEARCRPEVVQNLMQRYNYQLKFVVDTPEDFGEIEEYLAGFQDVIPNQVLLMPQATDVETMNRKAEWISPFCERQGYLYSPRMQIVWYGNIRRT